MGLDIYIVYFPENKDDEEQVVLNFRKNEELKAQICDWLSHSLGDDGISFHTTRVSTRDIKKILSGKEYRSDLREALFHINAGRTLYIQMSW